MQHKDKSMSGLYIHIPFCSSKCVYCGFYSVPNTNHKEQYINALEKEISLRRDYFRGGGLRTIYFGGGTPSKLEIADLGRILEKISENFDSANVKELTLEGNPEQLTADYCRDLRALGVNRLSIGVQSFQDPVLRFMGRRHTAEEAVKAIKNAVAAGFDNISIDLIYGVSERGNEQWREDLQTAFRMPIKHLSCYALTPEENSILYKQILNRRHAPVDEDLASDQYDILQEMIPHSTLRQYEVSNFAVPGFESKHNYGYWHHTPYLGLGPSAHSFDGHTRHWNPSNLEQYIQNMEEGKGCEGSETLTLEDHYNEKLLLGLRTTEGVDLRTIAIDHGEERRQQLVEHFRKVVAPELYTIEKDRLCLTAAGLWVADGIAQSAFVV